MWQGPHSVPPGRGLAPAPRRHPTPLPELRSAMSEPDMEADENGAGMGHTGGCGASEMRSCGFGAAEPDYEADPGALPGRMTVAPPLEVSTQAKLEFPFAPLAG